MAGGKQHLKEAFRWSARAEVTLADALAAGIGMAAPVLLAAVMGRISLGLAAAVGAMAVAGAGAGASTREQIRNLAPALGSVAAAAFAAALIAGHGWATDATIAALAGVAATIGGYSRALVVASTRFALFLLIAASVASAVDATGHAAWLLALVAAGGLWTSMLSVCLGAVVRARRHVDPGEVAAARPGPTAAQKLSRWKRSLAHLAGWQYALRLVLCLGVAGVLRWQWPEHHLYWIAVTVAILTGRRVEPFPVKITQRALGTALGVLVAGALLGVDLPTWALVVTVGLLAGARPLLRTRNYLAYSVVMTPLIILIMDAGKSPGGGVLIDRLAATLLGAALVISANLVFRRLGADHPLDGAGREE